MKTNQISQEPKRKQSPLRFNQSEGLVATHWYIVVCSSAAPSVTLQAGSSDDDNVVFAQWNQGDGQRAFAVPAQYQGLDEIYVQLNINGDGQTEAAVGYDGYCKKAFHFHDGNENHDISKDDEDDGAACT